MAGATWKGARERAGLANGGEKEREGETERETEEKVRGGQVSASAADYAGKLRVQRGPCVCMLFIRAHPCACNYVCVCVHEHADVYSFLRSNAHSQMKSSNVSARQPQLGSHGS